MFSIKKVSELTGVSTGTLRAWETRYQIGPGDRSENGYRVYEQSDVDQILRMKELLAQGWTHAAAAEAAKVAGAQERHANPGVSDGIVGGQLPSLANSQLPASDFETFQASLFTAARDLDGTLISTVLDQAFSAGAFEHVMESRIFPVLRNMGSAWTEGDFDIAAEHFVSNALMRRLGAFFEAASSNERGKRVLVGSPAFSHHEIAALALATSLRRTGLAVTYLGANVPTQTWVDSVISKDADAIVFGVTTGEDVANGQNIIDAFADFGPTPIVFAGGGLSGQLSGGFEKLKDGLTASANQVWLALNS